MRQDWQALYAANRSAIRKAGLPDPGVAHPGVAPRIRAARPAAPARRHVTVHTPPGLAPGVGVPLVCMLHGCTQDAASFAAATRMDALADREGFVVVYPQQERRANQQACWNWFNPSHQARGRGEPAAIAAIVSELAAETSTCTIDARRIFVAGFSAGGAMAAILANAYRDVFAAVAVHSGLTHGAAHDVRSAFQAMSRGAGHRGAADQLQPVPSLVIHGSADRTVAPINGEQVLRQAMGAAGSDPARPTSSARHAPVGAHAYTESQWLDARGELVHEALTVEGLAHAWSGGAPGAAYTDPRGPDATAAIWRFFDRVTQPRLRARG